MIGWHGTPFFSETPQSKLFMALNRVFLIGNIGQDPTVREVGDTKVANFTIATTDKGYTKKDGTQVADKTEWHDCVAWRGLADVVSKYATKGTKVFVEGKLTHRTADVRGEKRYYTEVLVDNLELLAKPIGGQPQQDLQAQPQPQPAQQPQQSLDGSGDDELPF